MGPRPLSPHQPCDAHESPSGGQSSQDWWGQSDRHRTGDTGPVHCHSSGDPCGVKDSSGDGLGSEVSEGLTHLLSLTPCLSPEGWSCSPTGTRKLRLREAKCIAPGHTASPRVPSQILAPCSLHEPRLPFWLQRCLLQPLVSYPGGQRGCSGHSAGH